MSSRVRSQPGYVYVIKCPPTFYKIGVSRNVPSRLTSLQTGSPVPLEVVCYRSFTFPIDAENCYHRMLSKHHHRGEWFNISEEVVECFLDVFLGPEFDDEYVAYRMDTFGYERSFR